MNTNQHIQQYPPCESASGSVSILIVRAPNQEAKIKVTPEWIALAEAEDRAFIRDNKERQQRMMKSPLLHSISL